MKFIDEVSFLVKAGDGGAGCVSFYRAKGVPLGGPDGGDGGNGGSVIFYADESVSTLLDLRFTRKLEAKNGQPGMGAECNGRAGESLRVRVPVGTLLWNAETGEAIADLDSAGKEVKVAQGGRGGLGNMNFATSTRQAPRFAQPGTPGEALTVRLELRLIADVGIIGFPNVGKSTLISRISAAKPKIADYPFTTLVPNLGVVRVGEGHSFVVADIPGLIPGASDGAGLGFQFLRHVSRVRLFVHVLAFDWTEGRDPVKDYEVIRAELGKFDAELLEKPEIIVLNKSELTESGPLFEKLQAFGKKKRLPVRSISAVTGQGLKELVYAVGHKLQELGAPKMQGAEKDLESVRPATAAEKPEKKAKTVKKPAKKKVAAKKAKKRR
ncbi:MAG: GTPase ObgE [Deltaproteobacteria bacterium]|nr:GTPase ObgE [Deltaproteobacteria bacterium]